MTEFRNEGDSDNPYAAPVQDVGDNEEWEFGGQKLDAANARYIRVGRTAVTWEKLRLLYNLILACVTVLTAVLLLVFSHAPMNPERLMLQVFFGVFFANVFFCMGPLVDGYLSWLNLRSAFTTAGIFVLGTIVAIFLTILTVAASTMPDF